jgi:ribosomal protein S18 acetylase RimI-like enzyme
LSGLATDTDFQGKGMGGIILKNALEILIERQCDILWCNAREADIPGIGPRKVMWRSIIV